MTRRIGLFLLVAGLGTATPALAVEGPVSDVVCAGEGTGQRCTVSAVQPFADNRGGLGELSISAVRDAACTSLYILFDEPIALSRPVTLAVDGAPPQRFYTPRQLSDLANALDADALDADALDEGPQTGAAAEAAPPEFARFLAQVAAGTIADEDAGTEMLRRFAAIKEPRRIGLTCGPMERLMPLVRSDRPLRLEFQKQAGGATQLYHWPRLDRRTVEFRLGGLLEALDRAMPGS
ncbi:hypothetical protein FBZ83_101315 [Azospirillum brasilense]|uniref:DUF302 domain-containing protein n=1 Tax=Azospirillum brasilense TaxID=192 RepID=A0A560CRG8_AZOBR|nr:hypothetical protein [Azospirillum brasilense]MBK3732022.1 hypothetical protein [Azospirillum brasilense]TWA87453.1 hypothetical protein FBZ83_101315 [Azospirillum brasilense]